MSFNKSHKALYAVVLLIISLSSSCASITRYGPRAIGLSRSHRSRISPPTISTKTTNCFTGLMLPRTIGKKISTLHAPFKLLEKRGDLTIKHLQGEGRFHITLKHANIPKKTCVTARDALKRNIRSLPTMSFILAKNNPITYFKVAGTQDEYHVMMNVRLNPANVGTLIDRIYQGILPARSLKFEPHITLGKVVTKNIDKVKRTVANYLRKSKIFEKPTKVSIDKVTFEVGTPGTDTSVFKLGRK